MKWTEEQLTFLKNNYIEKGAKYCADKIGRTTAGIRHKASRLGLKRKGEGRPDRIVNLDGYLAISSVNYRIRVHRKIMEDHLGRKLLPTEIVHHKDEDKTNNDISNLEVVTRSGHMKTHNKDRKRNDKGQFLSS